jgi:hypothetical protein
MRLNANLEQCTKEIRTSENYGSRHSGSGIFTYSLPALKKGMAVLPGMLSGPRRKTLVAYDGTTNDSRPADHGAAPLRPRRTDAATVGACPPPNPQHMNLVAATRGVHHYHHLRCHPRAPSPRRWTGRRRASLSPRH